jgi:hypothetical protein
MAKNKQATIIDVKEILKSRKKLYQKVGLKPLAFET